MMRRIYLSSVLLFLTAAVFGQDVSVALINSPSTACGHTSTETVIITVLNAGPATVLPPYTISYTINGGTPVVRSITSASDSIQAGVAFKSFLTQTANLSTAGVYNFESWITHASDPNHANDTAFKVVNSDSNTVPGVLMQSDTVCQGSNGAALQLTGNVGAVVGWLESTNNGASWFTVGAAGTDSSYTYSNLTQTTLFTVVVRSGTCPFDSATPATITVDSNSVAGTIAGAGNVCVGSNGTLTLTGFSGNVVDWETAQNTAGPWTGASNTTSVFNYTNIQATDDTLFRTRVKLGVCPEDTTPVVAITLDAASIGGTVSIVGNDTVCSGSNTDTLILNFHVGNVLRWEVSVNGGGTYTPVSGSAGLTSLTITNITQTSLYRAVVKNGVCDSAVSASVSITVNAASIGGTISSNTTICKGSGGSLTLTGSLGSIQRWEESTNGGTTWDTIFPINTTSSHTYTNLQISTLFRAVVKNGLYCNEAVSSSATITVNDSTIGGNVTTLNPDTVCANINSGTLTYAGGNGAVVDWEQSTDGGATFTSVPGPPVTTVTYNYTNITTTTLYRVMVQNAPCPVDFSDTLTITVLPASVAGSISATTPICSGDTLTLTLSGESGTVTTWRVSINGGTSFTNVAGSAGQTSISEVITINSIYRVIVQNGSCDADTTTDFSVVADPATVAGTVTGGAIVCGGNNSGTLTLTGHTGNILDWILSTDGGASWSPVPGSPVTTTTFNYSNLTQTTRYRVRVRSGVCVEDSASQATITVIPPAVGGTAVIISPNDSLCADTFTVTVAVSGHTGTVIGWEASENGGTSYTVISGASGTPESFNYNFTTNTLFRGLVQNGAACDTVRSSLFLVVVGNSSIGGVTAGIDTVCGGTNNGFVTVSGNTGNMIRWESSTNSGVSWNPEPNSDSVAYNYVGLNTTTWFRAVVQDVSCPIAFSDTVEIVIIPAAIGGVVTYAGGNVCSGSNNVTLNLSGSSGTILRWEKSPDGTTWTTIANTTTSLNEVNITATTHYRAVLKSGICPEVNSIPDTVFVDPASDAGVIAGAASHCDTANSGMVVITGYTGTIIGWQKQISGGGFSTISGSAGLDTISYINLVAGIHEYRAIVRNGVVCPEDTSLIISITVDSNVVAGTLTGGASYCSLTNSTLLQLNGYTDTVLTWQQSTDGGVTFTNITGSTGRDTITFVNITIPTIYRVIVSSGLCGTDTSNTQTIDVGLSVGGTLSQSDSVCISGNNGLLQLTGQTGAILVWQDSLTNGGWNNLSPTNAGIDTLRYTNLLQTTSYRVAVQSGTCDTTFSTVVTITVSDTVFAGTLSPNIFLCDTSNSDTLLLSGYFGPIKNWQVAINGGPFVDFVPTKTDSAYIFNNLKDSISVYRVVMDGGVCGSDTSNTDTVRVSASLSGTLTKSDTVCSGNNIGVIKLNNYKGTIIGWDSAGTNGIFFPMTYSLDSLIYINLTDTITYRVRIQNPGCPADTSNSVTIYTVPGTNAGILAGSRNFCSTTNTDSVILFGRSGNILMWQRSINLGTTWDTILGQTSDTLIYSNLTTTTLYRVIIAASGICPDDTSNIVIIQIGLSAAGTISGDTLLCAGDIANLLLSGFTGSVLNWQSSLDGFVWNPIPSSDTNIISSVITQNTYFRAIVQSDTCTPDTSLSFLVKADQPFAGSMQTPTTQLCYGIGTDTIVIVPGADTIFDWEFRNDTSLLFTSLSNTTLFQIYSNLTITTHFRAFVKNGVCPVDTTQITLTIDTFTVAGTLFGNDTVCAGTNTGTMFVTGFIGNTFNWQSSTDGVNFNPAPGATNDTIYVYNNLLVTNFYRLVVSSGGCPPDTTNTIQINVKPAAIGGTISSDTSFCKGPNGGVLNLLGYFGNIKGWQRSIGGSGFTNIIPPVVVDSLIYNNVDTTISYRVILGFGDCPDDTSATATITILKTPVTSISADGPTEFCDSGQVILSATGGPGYLWSTGETTNAIVVTSTGNYKVVVTDTTTGCTDVDSLPVSVYPAANIDAGVNVVIVEGQSVALNASGAESYEWSPKSGLSDGFIANPVASPTDSTLYIVVGIDSNGCSGSDSVLVAVIPGEPDGPPEFTNLFTPNGDGHNDYWNITTLANCTTCKVAMYNRYGQAVLQDDNYQNDWAGTFNGANLPDGTYYYVIETETGKIYKGAITILRGK